MPLSASLSISVPLHLLAEPPKEASGPVPALLALHGYAMDAEAMLGVARRLDLSGFLVIALQGPQTTLAPGTEGTSERRPAYHWGVSPHADENRSSHRQAVEAAIGWAVANGADPARISLLGFSQPCSFNYRLALDPPHNRPFRAVVGICGGLPGEWLAESPAAPDGSAASRAASALHVSTTSDPFYPLERVAAFGPALAARFLSSEARLFDGPHRVPSAALPLVREFLLARG